jgi:hypothetical protein
MVLNIRFVAALSSSTAFEWDFLETSLRYVQG